MVKLASAFSMVGKNCSGEIGLFYRVSCPVVECVQDMSMSITAS